MHNYTITQRFCLVFLKIVQLFWIVSNCYSYDSQDAF